MRTFLELEASADRSAAMKRIQRWIRLFICVVKPPQLVVGNRIDHVSGAAVTQEQFDAGSRAAHICPFVLTSIDRNQYWLQESTLTNNDQPAIEALLRDQMRAFLDQDPSYNPMGTGAPVAAPEAYIYKTYMTIFPNVIHTRGKFPLFDNIHANLKADFMHQGLMLGQFYHSCPHEEGAIYAPNFKSVILSSPIPAFAIRYMVPQDRIFNLHPEGEERFKDAHLRYFPVEPRPVVQQAG